MTSIRSHALLDHDADTVWAVIRDAGSIADWFPAMTSSSIEGVRRTVTLGDGSQLVEDIVTCDDALRRLQYTVVAGDLPVEAHLGTVDIIDIGGGRSVIVYGTDLEPSDVAAAFDAAISEAVASLNGYLTARTH